MKDFFRFVVRGTLGSAIAAASATLLIVMYAFGPSWENLYLFHPIVLVCFGIPGAIVGFVLWVVTKAMGTRLLAIWRVTIGIGVLPTIYFVIALYEMGGPLDRIDFTQFSFSTPFLLLLLWMAVTGGGAGLASPSGMLFTKETGLTYWDRVALYEIAQREAGLVNRERAHSIG